MALVYRDIYPHMKYLLATISRSRYSTFFPELMEIGYADAI